MKETYTLHPHQKKQNKAVRKASKTNQHILYGGPTGMGKSVILWDMVKRDLDKGLKVLVLAPRRTLVHQLYDTLGEYTPFMVMGSVIKGDYKSKLILSSVQTVNSKLKKDSRLFDNVDKIYIDEAHLGGNFPPMQGSQFQLLYDKYWTAIPWIGLTATPITAQGYRLEGWDTCVYMYQTGDLIDMGYLAKFQYLAPTEMDTSKLKVNSATNEYDVHDVEQAVNNSASLKSLVNHTVDNFQEYSTKCMVFCISIEHAKQVKRAFITKKLNTVILITHSKLTDKEQRDILTEFKESRSAILINVSILTTGFSDDTVNLVVLGRPIRSVRLFIQVAGRGLRVYGDKVCTFLDLCSTYKTCGLPDDHRDFNKVKPPKSKSLDAKDAKLAGKMCLLCNTMSPTVEWTSEKRIKSKFILVKWRCPSCNGISETRTDLKDIDDISEIVSSRQMLNGLREQAKGFKKLKRPVRYEAVSELIQEFTRYKSKTAMYWIKSIREAGNLDLLDYLIHMNMNKLADDITTYKGIDKLVKNARR